MKEEKDIIKETELEHKHIAHRADLKGITQCQEHKWRKESENEIACTVCPTVLRVENINDFLK